MEEYLINTTVQVNVLQNRQNTTTTRSLKHWQSVTAEMLTVDSENKMDIAKMLHANSTEGRDTRCHTDDLISHQYDIATVYLSHT